MNRWASWLGAWLGRANGSPQRDAAFFLPALKPPLQWADPSPPSFCALQALLVLAVLAVLPLGLRVLELATHCAGPVLEALQRYKQLQELRITGSGTGIEWGCRAAWSVLPKLVQLRMDCWEEPQRNGDYVLDAEIVDVPTGAYIALAAASRLRRLELLSLWREDLPALCQALPVLVELK